MGLKFVLFTLLIATCDIGLGSIQHNGPWDDRRNPANPLRPWGTVPSPNKNNGNPVTLSPLRPFGTVPAPTFNRPSGFIPGHPITTPYPGFPNYNYDQRYSLRRLEPYPAGSETTNNAGVPLLPISTTTSNIGSEPGVTLPPISTTERTRSNDREGGNSPRIYPSLEYFNRAGNPRGKEETATILPHGTLNRGIE